MYKFNQIYQEIYKNSGKELEELRKHNQKKIISVILISVAIAILTIYITKSVAFITLILAVDVIILCFSKSGKNYRKMFKEKIIKEFIKSYSDKLEYYPQMGIASRIYINSEFERFDNYYSEDYIQGTILDNLKFSMAEVHTEREDEDDEGNTSTYTLFHGLFAEIELTKFVGFNMKIRTNTILDGKIFNQKTKLEMDSAEFEKIFDVHTTDKIKCMQILTADIMQMLIDFKIKNKVIPEMTLKENKLYIRFNTGSVFEPKFTKRALDYDMLNKYYNIINFTLELSEKFSKNILEMDIE